MGALLPVSVPLEYARYLSVAVLAATDTGFGGIRAALEKKFDVLTFSTGFVTNALLAVALTFLGDRLGVELYYAALFAFGYRIFQNLGMIRHLLLAPMPKAGAAERKRE